MTKHLKSLGYLITALSASALVGRAQTASAPAPVEEPSASWVLTPSFVSQYMFRGTRLGGPAFQPSIEYDNGNVAFGIWSSTFLTDRVGGQSDPEFDFYGSYNFEVEKDTLSFVPGFTVYTYPSAKKANGFYRASVEPNVAVNYSLGPVKITPRFYYDFVLKGPTAELNVAYTIPLKDAGTELDFAGAYGSFIWKSTAADTVPDLKNWGDYFQVGVAAPFQITKASKITVGWSYTKGSNNYLKQGTAPKSFNPAAVGRGAFSLSYAIAF